jgi:hypothetical protein
LGQGIQAFGQGIAGGILSRREAKQRQEQARATANQLAELIAPRRPAPPGRGGGPHLDAAPPLGSPSLEGVDPKFLRLAELLRSPQGADFVGRFGPSLEQALIGQAFQEPGETFSPVLDEAGNVIGQRSSTSGRVVSDPRTPPAPGKSLERLRQEEEIKAGFRGNNITLSQQSNNEEIRAARGRLRALSTGLAPGQTLRELLLERTQRATDTGRNNPNFDPSLARDLRMASQRMVGEDPGFSEFFGTLDKAPPLPSQPAAVPEAAGNEPGLISQTLDFLLGGGSGASAATPQGPGAGRFPPTIETMSLEDIDDLVNTAGDSLSPADLQRIEARLRALGG